MYKKYAYTCTDTMNKQTNMYIQTNKHVHTNKQTNKENKERPINKTYRFWKRG